MDADSPKTSTLYALHKHIATTCKSQNRAFLACKESKADPSKCLDEGKAVITCVKDLFKALEGQAGEKMKAYCDCLDYYTYKFEKCQKERVDFEEACPVTPP